MTPTDRAREIRSAVEDMQELGHRDPACKCNECITVQAAADLAGLLEGLPSVGNTSKYGFANQVSIFNEGWNAFRARVLELLNIKEKP